MQESETPAGPRLFFLNANCQELAINFSLIIWQLMLCFSRNDAGLLFLLVVVGVVNALHKDFAVGDAVGEGATELPRPTRRALRDRCRIV